MIKSLSRAASLSAAEVEVAVDAISEWAEAERAWLKDHRPDPCYQTAYDAYSQGMSEIALGSITLKILLTPPTDEAELQAAVEQINRGLASADHALQLTMGVDCRATASASPDPTAAPDPATAYIDAATEANRAYAALRSSGVGGLTFAREWLTIERDARSRVERLGLADPAGAELLAAMDGVIAVLRQAAAAPTNAEADSTVGVAILAALPKQRVTASSVREALDLPPVSDESLL